MYLYSPNTAQDGLWAAVSSSMLQLKVFERRNMPQLSGQCPMEKDRDLVDQHPGTEESTNNTQMGRGPVWLGLVCSDKPTLSLWWDVVFCPKLYDAMLQSDAPGIAMAAAKRRYPALRSARDRQGAYTFAYESTAICIIEASQPRRL